MIKTIKNKIIMNNKYYRIENNEVLFKEKHKGEHLRIIPATLEGIAVLPLNKKGKIIIQDEYRYAYGGFITQLVKGGIKPTQTPEEAVKEELEEELSLSYKELIPLGTYIENPSILCQKGYAFLAIDCEYNNDSLNSDESECFKNKITVNFNNLVEDVLNNKIECAVTQMLILKANEYLKKNN